MIHRNGSGSTLHARFERHAEQHPERTALVTADEELTYGELNARANRLAWRLRELGVGAGTLVGTCTDRSTAMVVGVLGILKAGGAYTPFDATYPADRLKFMLADSAVPVMVTAGRPAAALPLGDTTVVSLDEQLTGPTDNLPATEPADLAYVIYTSGSTGRPKGVLVPHEAVLNLVTDQAYVSISPDDRVAALATLSFDASTFEIWGPLVHGAACVLYAFSGSDVSTLCQRVRLDRVSVLHLTSPVFRLLEPAHYPSLTGVHTLLFGGDSIRSQVVKVARDSFAGRLIHLYGPTETTGFATFHEVRVAPADDPTIPIGIPIGNVHVRVLGPDMAAVRNGKPGELHIGGAGMTRGYLNRPDLTAERFVRDPDDAGGGLLYRTGDLVSIDQDGEMRFLGRLDRQVKVRGYRVEPGEVEAAIIAHPAVQDAVVVARDDGAGDKLLDAYVVPLQAAATADPSFTPNLRKHIVQVLPRYQHPASITLIEALPLTTNLKLDLAALPALRKERAWNDEAPAPARDEVESTLARLWSSTLGHADIGIDDDFFELGGDSIAAVRMAAETARATGVPVSIRDFIGARTIRQLTALVALRSGGPAEGHASVSGA